MGATYTYFGIAIRPISRFSSAPERSVLQGMPGRFIFHSHIYSDVCNSCFTFPHRSQFSLQHHRLLVIKIILSRIGDLNLNFLKNVYIKYCFRISLINFYSILTQIHLLRYLLINFSKLFFLSFRVTGLYPTWDRFAIYYAVVCALHFIGEIITVGTMGVLINPNIANSTSALVLTASLLLASGLLRYRIKIPYK